MKTATLKFIGTQPGIGRIPDVGLYNVLALSEPHPRFVIGTTTTIASVEKAGYEAVIQESDSVKQNPPGRKCLAFIDVFTEVGLLIEYVNTCVEKGYKYFSSVDVDDEIWCVATLSKISDDEADAIFDQHMRELERLEKSDEDFDYDKPFAYKV